MSAEHDSGSRRLNLGWSKWHLAILTLKMGLMIIFILNNQLFMLCLASRSQVWVLAWKGILETWKRRGWAARDKERTKTKVSAQGSFFTIKALIYKGRGRDPIPAN